MNASFAAPSNLASVLAAGNNANGLGITNLASLGFRDTSAAFDVTLGFTSSPILSAARALTIDVNNAANTLALQGGTNAFKTSLSITEAVGSSALTLTGATQTANFPVLSATQTWNNGAVVFTGLKLNITSTASNVNSLLIDLQTASVSQFTVSKAGVMMFGGNAGGGSWPGFLYATAAGVMTLARGDGATMTQWNNTCGFSSRKLILDFAQSTGTITEDGSITHDNTNLLISAVKASSKIILISATPTIQLGADAAGVTNQLFTAANRITSDGVGANLTISGGNGRGGAGGELILSYYTTAGAATAGTLTTAIRITTTGAIILAALPTVDPAVSGQLFKTAGAVFQSA